jgi:hypothetical protein
MWNVEVLIPFIDKETSNVRVKGEIFEISEERLAEIKSVNVNMVLVLGEVETKPKKTTKKK